MNAAPPPRAYWGVAEPVGVELGIAPLFDIALPFGLAPFIDFEPFMLLCMEWPAAEEPVAEPPMPPDEPDAIEPELMDDPDEPIEPLAWAVAPVASASVAAPTIAILIM